MNQYGYQSVWQIEDREMFTDYEDLLAWLLDNAHEVFGHKKFAYYYELMNEDEDTTGALSWDVWVRTTDPDEQDEEYRYGEECVTVTVRHDTLVTKRF